MANRKLTLLGLLMGNLILIGSTRADEPVMVNVHADQVIGKISPYVYGIDDADWAKTPDVTFTRMGGNRLTAWNWETNASNAGQDWHNQNDNMFGGDQPGQSLRKFLAPAMQRGKAAIVTVPMAGYVSADKNPPGDVNQTPDFIHKRFEPVLPKKNSPFEFPPNLNDHAVYDDEMVWWIDKEFPVDQRHGGEIFYDLDNEPDLWQETHSRIHPQHVTYAEMAEKTRDYGSGIKDVDPTAMIFGFVSYGWNGFKTLQGASDGNGRDFIDFLLDSMSQVEKQQNRRVMDVLDLHWYPEATGINAAGKPTRIATDDISPGVAEARMQAPRSLWDKTYVETSWITKSLGGEPINLLPRMFEKIQQHYPGTKLAFTEYDYGGVNHISGAIAEAEVLGIMGRDGVFAAAHWGNTGNYMLAAFDSYRNYDGKKSAFGDTAIAADSSKIEDVTVYASKFEKGNDNLIIVLINRSSGPRQCTLNVSGFPLAKISAYSLTAQTPKVKPTGEQNFSSGQSLTLPPLSVSTLVMRK